MEDITDRQVTVHVVVQTEDEQAFAAVVSPVAEVVVSGCLGPRSLKPFSSSAPAHYHPAPPWDPTAAASASPAVVAIASSTILHSSAEH